MCIIYLIHNTSQMSAKLRLSILLLLALQVLSLTITEKTPETAAVCTFPLIQPSRSSIRTKTGFSHRPKRGNTSTKNTCWTSKESKLTLNSSRAASTTSSAQMIIMTDWRLKNLLKPLSPRKQNIRRENLNIIQSKNCDISYLKLFDCINAAGKGRSQSTATGIKRRNQCGRGG